MFLIASIIDLEADQNLSDLVARVAAAKKAYDDEYTELKKLILAVGKAVNVRAMR